MTVKALHELTRNDTNLAGGKGANLGELISAGFPVPPGFVVCADSYAAFVKEIDIPSIDDAERESIFTTIPSHILDAELPEDLRSAIQSHHHDIASQRTNPVIYAVRSSATAEDTADASFAGQHDTYYYVQEDNLDLMIKKCWASLWSEAAISYRESQGIEHKDVHMAVVVQEMIQSEVSGVSFTCDPVSGSHSVIVTESSWGMGAAIVDGRVSPDQYIVDKQHHALTAIKISDKKFMVPPRITPEQSSRLMEVPANQRRVESLTDDQAVAIAEMAHRAEQHFDAPQDIEWALQDGELFMLQSRPITVTGSITDDEPEGRYVLFKPVAENFTDPLLPLTQDILLALIPMMDIIHGRVYMKFEHIRALIPLKLSDDDIARLAYLSEPSESKMRVSLPRLLLLGVIVFFNYLIMGVFNRRTANMPDDFMASFRDYFKKVVSEDVTPQEAMIRLFLRYRFFEPAGNMVLLVNLVAPRYMIFLRVLGNLVNRWAPELPTDTASILVSGSQGVLSTEMGREILDLSKVAKSSVYVTEVLSDQPAKEALAALRESSDEGAQNFCDELDSFLAKHGHRALKEFELSSVRWEEDPSPVLGMVRNYLMVDDASEDTEANITAQRKSLLEDVERSLRSKPFEFLGRPRWRLINFLINQTKYYMKLRENSRFYHIMGFYAARKKVLETEASLLSRGLLKCKDDIFYLSWSEVEQLDQEQLQWRDIEDAIRSRRMEHIRLTKLVPPKTIGFEIEELTDLSGDSSSILSGQGASPGQYEGIAKVIMDPATNNEIKPGEILVAPYTDPAWTPLFLTANAAVIEVGSYLSHAGTIAREYGMPCVVDASNCTSKIKTGTRIIVDGTQGKVQIVTEEANT